MHSATVLFALAAVVACAHGGAIGVAPVVNDLYAYPQYKTSYGVHDRITGDQKAAVEVREGGITKGSYSFVQPDGVVRTVNYIVTPLGGFQAQVINKGVAGHPAILGIGKGGRGLLSGLGVLGNIGPHVIAASSPVGEKVAAPASAVQDATSAGSNQEEQSVSSSASDEN